MTPLGWLGRKTSTQTKYEYMNGTCSKHLDRQAWENSADADQTPHIKMLRPIWFYTVRQTSSNMLEPTKQQGVKAGLLKFRPRRVKYEYMNNICSKYLDRQAWANGVDADQTPPYATSDLRLHCLWLILQIFGNKNR